MTIATQNSPQTRGNAQHGQIVDLIAGRVELQPHWPLKVNCFAQCDPPRTSLQQKEMGVVRDKRSGRTRGVMYTRRQVKQAMKSYRMLFLPYRLQDLLTGPVAAEIDFIFKCKHPSKSEKSFVLWPKVTKPDVDNMGKLFLDSISGYFMEDDARVTCLTVRKWWSTICPGVWLRLKEMQ